MQDDLARNLRYYNKGITEVKKYVLKPNLEHGELELLQQYTKIILTELINMGYSQEYIYTTIKKVFFCETSPIDNVEEAFDKFIGFFSLRKRQYAVYLPLNNIKAKEELLVFNGLSIETNVFEMFENTCSYIIKLKEKAMDPEEAKTEAVGLIDFGLSVSQYCRHNKRTYLFKCAEIVDLETHEVYYLKSLAQPISRQQRTHVRVNKLISACFSLESGIFTAINLHSSAFETRNIKNQLLNLWTAMEVLIPIERSGSLSRINQISNYASTILSSHYVNMLLSHLDSQILEMLGSKYTELVNAVDGEFQKIEKLLALLILPEYDKLFTELLPLLNEVPLLKFKLQQYKNIFSYGPHIAEFYKRHTRRVTWQIMRIYRNRNMIVHDGSTLPFLDVILQNLHFYIDTIIDRFCDMSEHGFKDASSIIVQLTQNEKKYLSVLASQKTYCKADFLKILGNSI